MYTGISYPKELPERVAILGQVTSDGCTRVFHAGHSALLDYYATIYGTQYVIAMVAKLMHIRVARLPQR